MYVMKTEKEWLQVLRSINPFIPNAPFRYPLKTDNLRFLETTGLSYNIAKFQCNVPYVERKFSGIGFKLPPSSPLEQVLKQGAQDSSILEIPGIVMWLFSVISVKLIF